MVSIVHTTRAAYFYFHNEKRMKVLLAGLEEGFGGRDHALAWKLTQSPHISSLIITRGNAATRLLPKVRNVSAYDGGAWTAHRIVGLAVREQVDFAVVGPESQLAAGLVDMLQETGIPTFGPTQVAAQLETSKSFAIELMQEAIIPCPRSWIFIDQSEALTFAHVYKGSVVVKLDGPAFGKGVWICKTQQDAIDAVVHCMKEHPKETLVIQELLEGVEVSVFCFTDGYTVSDSIAACDYKQRFDEDKGPNTGSMGSFSWPRFWNERLAEWIRNAILQPIVETMRSRGIIYKGVIYAGLMLTADGPMVLEFNCRLGDAEAQVILPLLQTDPMDIMMACVQGRLQEVPVLWDKSSFAATVVMVDPNYPNSPRENNGDHVEGLSEVKDDVIVFHYGTVYIQCKDKTSYVVVAGSGRRFAVTAVGTSYEEVLERVYRAVKVIKFPGAAWRSDIGKFRDLPEKLVPLYT